MLHPLSQENRDPAQTTVATSSRPTGKTPVKHNYTVDEVKTISITDHDGEAVTLAWYPNPDFGEPDKVPPFPFQVYITTSASETAEDVDFPAKFACFLARLDNGGGALDGAEGCHHHFEIYTHPQPNVLACVAHQRREVSWRNRNGIWPRVLSSWTSPRHQYYNGFIVVIDSDSWATDGGIVSVQFDPVHYSYPNSNPRWNQAEGADRDIVHAARRPGWRKFTLELARLWVAAGAAWAQSDLERRNQGGVSPALYPAVDPLAHMDAESDDLPDPATAQTEADNDTGDGKPRIVNMHNRNDLWISFADGTAPSNYKREVYQDSTGNHVVSIWDGRHSTLRPSFSITLYLSRNAFWTPEAHFHCLNKGLIADEAWTLDVKRDFDSIETAFEHHSKESVRRTATRVERRSSCINMLLRKIAGHILPSELLEYIQDLLVLPTIPSYAAVPSRIFRNFFLYFGPTEGAKSKADVPCLVYSDPVTAEETIPQIHVADSTYQPHEAQSSLRPSGVLRVINQRYWHRVSDELHILWSLCAPRDTHALTHTGVPEILLNIEIRDYGEHHPDTHVNDYSCVYSTVTLIFDQPIILHTGYGNLDLDCGSLELLDVTNGTTISPPFGPWSTNMWTFRDSWALTPELGFLPKDPNWGWRIPLRPLTPGVACEWDEFDFSKFWFYDYNGVTTLLQHGHEYVLRLRPGMTVPRWTFGTMDHRLGPYNLPPLPVRLAKEVRFTYEDEEEVADDEEKDDPIVSPSQDA